MASIDAAKLVEAMGDAVVVVDVAGQIVMWNPAATRIFGFTEEQALGRSLDIIIPERQRGRHWEGYAKTVDTGITRYGASLLRVPALHRDGGTLSIAFTVALLTDAAGKVTAVASVIRDETARFAEERALRKQLTEAQARLAAGSTTTTT